MSSDSLVAEVPKITRRPLQFAYFCLILFMLVYYARPEDWIPGVSVIPLAKTTGALLILAFLLSLGQVRGLVPREVIYLVLLLLQFFLSVPFSPVWRGGAFWNTLNFAKVVPVVFVLVWVLNTMLPVAAADFFADGMCYDHCGRGRVEGSVYTRASAWSSDTATTTTPMIWPAKSRFVCLSVWVSCLQHEARSGN